MKYVMICKGNDKWQQVHSTERIIVVSPEAFERLVVQVYLRRNK